MMQSFKTKVAHLLDNGDKLELEAFVEADSHDHAFTLAQARLKEVVSQLAAAPAIDIDKSKIEQGAHKH
ncbi:hypothetical protein [Zobellella iuensis]|uniref:Uncharacterized protein n=1 Tax=Zobellella iuensis TaxID=2803811 RepID=A0ABS1QZ45_9GAMM|nr:hypothetical protein [Zobellella iuensis]MBL1379499.1 hypothetical protein [Zobellella iuensis]